MFQSHYKSKAKRKLAEMVKFDKDFLSEVGDFCDAVDKISLFTRMHENTLYYIGKFSDLNDINRNILNNKIKSILNSVYNQEILKSLNTKEENGSLQYLHKVMNDLTNSRGHGFDEMILDYIRNIQVVIAKHSIIYNNFKLSKIEKFTPEDIENLNNMFKPHYEDLFHKSLFNMFESTTADMDNVDSLYDDVVDYVKHEQKASTSLLQRRFGIGIIVHLNLLIY